MHKAKLFDKLSGDKVRCTACQRYCQISQNKVGFCSSRKNTNGQLYSLNYGYASGVQLDPIEKKPLYHFYPGSQVLSIGSFGCNFRCKQCQNWDCSWGATKILSDLSNLDYLSPEDLVDLAISRGSPGLAFTYNEPAIWPEYVRDAAKLAKKKGLYTVFVSNGSWTREALAYYGKFIDAANIDLKGWGEKVYKIQGAFWGQLLDNLILAYKKYQIHLELTTLLIPGINDKKSDLEKLASWIAKNLGPRIPWHLSRYSPVRSPDEKFAKIPPTPEETLKKAYQIGKKAQLDFVYVWAPDEGKEKFLSYGDTFCPKCKKKVLKRSYWQPEFIGVKQFAGRGVCQYCKTDLYLKI